MHSILANYDRKYQQGGGGGGDRGGGLYERGDALFQPGGRSLCLIENLE
jgi:hypothetical protein